MNESEQTHEHIDLSNVEMKMPEEDLFGTGESDAPKRSFWPLLIWTTIGLILLTIAIIAWMILSGYVSLPFVQNQSQPAENTIEESVATSTEEESVSVPEEIVEPVIDTATPEPSVATSTATTSPEISTSTETTVPETIIDETATTTEVNEATTTTETATSTTN